jgi:hypothetical protein
VTDVCLGYFLYGLFSGLAIALLIAIVEEGEADEGGSFS